MGYLVTKGVNVGAHELFTPKALAMPSKLHTPAMDGQECCWEACIWITVELGGQQATLGVDWWCLASIGVDWHKRALTWKFVKGPSRISAQV